MIGDAKTPVLVIGALPVRLASQGRVSLGTAPFSFYPVPPSHLTKCCDFEFFFYSVAQFTTRRKHSLLIAVYHGLGLGKGEAIVIARGGKTAPFVCLCMYVCMHACNGGI